MEKMILNEDGSINFEKFNLLNESEKADITSKWSEQQQFEYLMQNTISEEECFAPVFEIIKEIEDMEKNGSSICWHKGERNLDISR